MLILILLTLFQGEAQAWYGPICYSDRTTQLTLTIPSISGETPGDLKVDFDDNDGKVKLGGVRASTSVKNAHEVLLVRDAESQNGIFGVVVTSPRSTTGYKFELEFRKDASECTGAIIKATDHGGGGLLAHTAPAPRAASAPRTVSAVTLASAHVKHVARAPKPSVSPSPSPAQTDEGGATPVQVVNLDDSANGADVAKPLPTPSAGSEAPAVIELQEAGEAPKAEAPVQPTATPEEAGSEAPKTEQKSESPALAAPADSGSEAPAEAGQQP